MPKVNLVPREEQAREFRRQFYIIPVAGAILLVGFLGGSFFYYNGQLQNADDQLEQMKASNNSLQKQVAELNRYQDTKNKKQTQQNTVNGLYTQRVRWSRTLDDLTFIIPEDVWLKTIKGKVPGADVAQQKSGAAAGSTQPDFEVDGFTREMTSVATFMTRLGLIPSLTEVTLVSAEKEEINKQLVVHFIIKASLKQDAQTPQPAVAPTTGESGPSTSTTGTSTSPTTATGTTGTTGTSGTTRTTGTTR